MTQESDVCKVGEYACANDSMHWIYNRSCCELVYTLTIVTWSIFEGPILGLFLSPFLRGPKMGQNLSRCKFYRGEKLSMLLYDILTTATCWWCWHHNTHAASKNAKNGVRGRKKNRLMKYRQIFNFGGSRRRSRFRETPKNIVFAGGPSGRQKTSFLWLFDDSYKLFVL